MHRSIVLKVALALAVPAGYLTPAQAATVVYDEVGGRVVVEAEHFASKIDDPDGHHYHIVPNDDAAEPIVTEYKNARGNSYIVALPDVPAGGVNHNNASLVFGPPSVDYKVNINTPGTYRLWLRWKGYDGSSDSMYASIQEIGSPAWYRFAAGVAPTDGDFASTTGGTGWDGVAAPSTDSGNAIGGGGGEVPAVYTLAGGVYTIRLAMREDGSAVDAIMLQLTSLADPTNPGPNESGATSNYIAVTAPPVDAVAAPGKTATFTVAASGTGTLTYQWQSKAPAAADFSNISGANAASYTTPPTTDAVNGTLFRVVINNGTKTVNSATAKLGTDGTPPSVVQVIGGQGGTSVSIAFTEKLDVASAQNTANYTIAGLAVSSATLTADGMTVVLLTAKQTAEAAYTVSVNGVKDLSGNAMTVAGGGSFHGPTVVAGKVLVRFYKNIAGTAVANLTTAPTYPNSPDSAALWDVFSSGDSTGDTFGDNYGAELTGFYTAPATGTYKFYIRSDDASQLFLSTDVSEANLKLIAQQTGCCNAFTDTPGSLSSLPLTLTKGQAYFFKAFLKEGGGGDYIQVGVLGPNDGDINDASQVVPISADTLSTGYSKTATLNISSPPANVAVAANSPATFTVGIEASSVLGTGASVQWQRAEPGSATFNDIAGATGRSYTLQFPTSADNGAKYRVVANITFDDPALGTSTSATSQAATLTVNSDVTPPVVTGVGGGLSQIFVYFNEPLDAASAATAANYKIAGGPNATSASVISAAGKAGAVAVKVTGAVPGSTYSVTITGVKDTAGNPVASTTKTYEAFHIISNFNDGGVPPGAGIGGNANIQPSGGPDGSGFLELTANANSLQGSLVYPDVLGGTPVSKFTAQFKLYIGNGSGNPADGFSFSLASDVAADPTAPPGINEEGIGTGLIVSFDTYDNGGGEAPAISVKFAGNEFAKTNLTKAALVNSRWVDVLIRLNADATIDVFHDNIKYFEKLPVEGFAPIAGAQLGLGGRTGGENERNWVDDLKVVYNAEIAVNEPPSVTITAPTDGTHLAAGASATIQVDAKDKENQIAKVEFFANGSKLGESTTPPYSLAIPSVPQGAYIVSAKVTDVPGLSAVSQSIKVVAGNPKKIYFVTADPGPLTFAGDIAVANHLYSRGFDVITARGSDVPEDGSTAAGSSLIIESSSLGSGTVEFADPAGGPNIGKFKNLAIPAIEWEASNMDAFGFMAANPAAGTSDGQTDIEIVDPASPLAAGFPKGNVTVVTAPSTFSQGNPVGSHIVAQKSGDNTQQVLFYYEKGDKGYNDFVMPERRVFFFFQDNTAANANANGFKLFDAAVDWALHQGAVAPAPVLTVTRSGAQVTVTWINGGTLEKATSVAGPYTSTGVSSGTYTEAGGTGGAFFRVRR